MKISEFMCDNVICVNPNATIEEVAKKMKDNHIGAIPVCDNNKVVGLVTDRDLVLRGIACEKDSKKVSISEIMTTKLQTATPNDELEDVTKKMCECNIKRVLIVNNGDLTGIVTLSDLSSNPKCSNEEVGNIMESICGCGSKTRNAE